MIFRLVPMFDASTRFIPGRLIPSHDFTLIAAGVIALGAMVGDCASQGNLVRCSCKGKQERRQEEGKETQYGFLAGEAKSKWESSKTS